MDGHSLSALIQKEEFLPKIASDQKHIIWICTIKATVDPDNINLEKIMQDKKAVERAAALEKRILELQNENNQLKKQYSESQKIIEKETLENKFGKVNDEMVIYMHEEWFEKQAKSLNITKSVQNKNYIEVIIPKDISSKIDGEMLFFTAYDICKYFRFSYIDNEIHIILDIAKLDKHFIFYFNELLEKIIVNIKN